RTYNVCVWPPRSPAGQAGSMRRWSIWRRRWDSIPETANRLRCCRCSAPTRCPGRLPAWAGCCGTTRSSPWPSARCAWSRGWAAREQGVADEAALVLTRVLRRDPDNAEVRAQLEAALRARSRRRGESSMVVSTAEFKKGLRIVYDGAPYQIVNFQHVKPGKGGAFVRTKLKHMRQGKVIDN